MAPCKVLSDGGMNITQAKNGGIESWRDSITDRIIHIEEVPYDVVVMQLPSRQDALDTIPLLQAQGVAVVVDFDDDYWAFHPGHFMKDHEDRFKMSKAAMMADLVTVTTPALARKIKPWTVNPPKVVRNCIPESYLATLALEHDGMRVGWSGNPDTHPADLEAAGDAVRRVVRANGATFYSVGTDLSATLLGFDDKETLVQDWVPLELYPEALKQMDIGIVPLQSNAFNDAKSYLKGLEYASLGIPFVASATPEYERLKFQGVGLTAMHKQEWYKKLNSLLQSQELRAELIGTGLEFAQINTYEINAFKWEEAWELAIKNRKKDLTRD
jgi:glycosyltransferase involved in cell wall biosynthesis